MPSSPSPNFAFLGHHDPRLVALGTQAEEHFANDPNVTLYKLRQFCEVLTKRAAAKVGLFLDPRDELRRIIDALSDRGAIGATQRDLFHQLRRAGNEAVHDLVGTQSEALHQLKIAYQLGIWFQRAFGNNKRFDPGPYIPPAEPKQADSALQQELERLRKETETHASQLEAARRDLEEAKRLASPLPGECDSALSTLATHEFVHVVEAHCLVCGSGSSCDSRISAPPSRSARWRRLLRRRSAESTGSPHQRTHACVARLQPWQRFLRCELSGPVGFGDRRALFFA